MFNDELARLGYMWRFDATGGSAANTWAKNGPIHYKGLEICLLGMSLPANISRKYIVNALAKHLYECADADLTPAFDGHSMVHDPFWGKEMPGVLKSLHDYFDKKRSKKRAKAA